ncbi:hypothetical protein CHARACLAT_020903 [Characodon lateralis]|uniref:Uncharacterized protein n=1 Tax=Characodon lateralis TaxID=208331 RepID=A0ABU7EEE5_9TELE|nr:hypothetical protein [Characodon lateralis]
MSSVSVILISDQNEKIDSPDTLDEANKRETKYTSTMCPTSEIESEDEGALRQKRRSRPNQIYIQSDSDDHSSGDGKRKKFVKPPDVGFPGQIAKSSQSRKVLLLPTVPSTTSARPRSTSSSCRIHSDKVQVVGRQDTTLSSTTVPLVSHNVHIMASEGTTSTRMIQCLWCLIMVAIIA